MSKAEKFSICDQCGSSWPTHKFYNCPSCEALNFKDCQRRELVKQYAGVLMQANMNRPDITSRMKPEDVISLCVNTAHALAKAVLESLETEKQKGKV